MSTTEGMEEKRGISRRDLIKKGAVAGAIVWTVPLIESVPAYAVTGSGPFSGASKAFVVYVDCNNDGYVASYTNSGGNCTVGDNSCYLPTSGSGTVSVSVENGDSGTLFIDNWSGSKKQHILYTKPGASSATNLNTQDCSNLTQVGNTITANTNYKIIAVVAFGASCQSDYIDSSGTTHPTNSNKVKISGTGTGNSVTITGL